MAKKIDISGATAVEITRDKYAVIYCINNKWRSFDCKLYTAQEWERYVMGLGRKELRLTPKRYTIKQKDYTKAREFILELAQLPFKQLTDLKTFCAMYGFGVCFVDITNNEEYKHRATTPNDVLTILQDKGKECNFFTIM